MGRFLRLVNGFPRMQDEASSSTPYEETYVVPSGGISTGVAITLPNSKTYSSIELEVYWNGQSITAGNDYNYVGTIPRTQISFTFDLLEGEQIKFRID